MALCSLMRPEYANYFSLIHNHSNKSKPTYLLLYYRSQNSFKSPEIDDRIANIRFQHFDEKRKNTIRLIYETIRDQNIDKLEASLSAPKLNVQS